MRASSTLPKSDNKNQDLQIWLQTIAIGFGIASVGIIIALVLYILFKK